MTEIQQILSSRNQQPVSTTEGIAAAKRVNAACYIETSPAVEKNVHKLINNAIKSVLEDGSETKSCSLQCAIL